MKNLVIVSHRRSGTHLTIDSVINNFAAFSTQKYISLDGLFYKNDRIVEEKIRSYIAANSPCLIKTHILPNFHEMDYDKEKVEYVIDIMENSKIIYVSRDGRDVMVSLYNYMLGFHEETKSLTFSDFLKGSNIFDHKHYHNVSRVHYWLNHVKSWEQLIGENCIHVTYSELESNNKSVVNRIGDFIGIKPNEKFVNVFAKRKTKPNEKVRKIKKVLQMLGLSSIRRTSIGFHTGGTGKYKEVFSSKDEEYYNDQISKFELTKF